MKRIDTINVIPMIDIMLVMLAIVLTTATFINHSQIELNLPVSDGGSQSDEAPLTIQVDAAGAFYLEGQRTDIGLLAQRVQSLESSTAITLQVDRDAAFQHFAELVGLLRENQLTRVAIVVQPAQ